MEKGPIWQIQAACQKLTELPKLRAGFTLIEFQKWTYVADYFLQGYALADDTKLLVMQARMEGALQHLLHRSAVHGWVEGTDVLASYFAKIAGEVSEEVVQAAKALKPHPEKCGQSPRYIDCLDLFQQPSEPLDSFALRVRKVAALSLSQNGAPLPAWVLREAFCHGVSNPHVRQHLLSQPALPTLDAALDSGLAKIAELETSSTYPPNPLADVSTQASTSVASTDLTTELSTDLLRDMNVDGESLPEKQAYTDFVTARRAFTRTVNEQPLLDILEVLALARKNRTVVDFRRHCKLCAPNLTIEEKKNIMETPDDPMAIQRLCMELSVVILPWCTFKFGRPLVSYNFKVPRLGPAISILTGDRPVLTPGKWLADLEKCATRISSVFTSQEKNSTEEPLKAVAAC